MYVYLYIYIYICINQIYLTKKKMRNMNKMIYHAGEKMIQIFKEGYILSFLPLALDINGHEQLHQTLSSTLFVLMPNIQDISPHQFLSALFHLEVLIQVLIFFPIQQKPNKSKMKSSNVFTRSFSIAILSSRKSSFVPTRTIGV